MKLQISTPQVEYGTSKLKTVRQELSRLDPPKWTKQQQPKRVFKSEDHRLSNVLQTNKAVSSSLLRYNARQIQILNKNFIVNRNPLSNEFHRIANETSLDHYQVKKWFQNRRAKERRSAQKLYDCKI